MNERAITSVLRMSFEERLIREGASALCRGRGERTMRGAGVYQGIAGYLATRTECAECDGAAE